MEKLRAYKVVSNLPSTLEPNTIYLVKRTGLNHFEIFVTNNTGSLVAHRLRQPFSFSGSGRAYLDLNTWRGFNNAYGFNQQNLSQGMGTGANPSITHARNGYLVPKDSVLEEILINGYHNNAEAMEIEIALTCFETIDDTTTTNIVWQKVELYKTDNTNARVFQFSIMEKCPKGSEILLAYRKINGSGTRRYFYQNYTMNFVLLDD